MFQAGVELYNYMDTFFCCTVTSSKEFEQTFWTTPMKWIVSRRLEEARRLIEQEKERPLDVYLRVGFKNLSHFSTAYKRQYGYPPSTVSA